MPRPAPSRWRELHEQAARVAGIGVRDDLGAEEQALIRQQTLMAAASVPVITVWGVALVIMGAHVASLWPFGYVLATLLFLLYLRVSKDHTTFRIGHPLLVLIGPWGLHWQLGGLQGSGGSLLWCFLLPVSALMFMGARAALPWFLVMAAAMAAALLREGPFAVDQFPLDRDEIAIIFAFNLLGLSAFMFLSMRYFVGRTALGGARSDALLLNVLPEPIAERLKAGATVIADRAAAVTVLFADVVGFTRLSASLDPARLIEILDDLFRACDDLAAAHGLEKIKTIGDSYLAVAGLPTPLPDHAAAAAAMALALPAAVAEVADRHGVELAVRVGLHSGPVVAGVIGKHKFSYDLWGDTVNTASRMESHGEAGRVQVSDATAALLDGQFAVEPREPIEVKGKGRMQTYWLGPPPSPATPP